MEGTIKWYNPKNGYGFIAGEDGEDYFVHFTAIPQGVKVYPDDKVTFDAVETEKGKQAQNVQKIGEAAPEEQSEVTSEAAESQEEGPIAETEIDQEIDAATEEAMNAEEVSESAEVEKQE